MGTREDIRFYCGLKTDSEGKWNYHRAEPGPYACIAPVYGRTERTKAMTPVWVPPGTRVILDSGAFSDGPASRLSVEAALARQLAHMERYGYREQVEAIASYDLLIDEKWQEGVRVKARWTEEDAAFAVKQTVRAAAYMSHNKRKWKAVLSAQGVSAQQYLGCAGQIIPYMESSDMFGLGGWCITGKLPARMMPVFRETMQLVIPFLAKEQVRRVHIWGVIFPRALGELLWLCDTYGLQLSTDSMGPVTQPCFGQWGYGSWRDKTYSRPPVEYRGAECTRHVALTREWLAHFREREPHLYCFVPVKKRPLQLALLKDVS